MDKTVPAGAALLLDFIGQTEAPKGYDTVYGNNQDKLDQPLTTMALSAVLAAQPSWTKRFGSSAAGRYQFMKATLDGLVEELKLKPTQKLDANLQDRLGFHLLKRRSYEAFMAGTISRTEFGKRLAQEWASFPVLTATTGQKRKVERGQSYYAGDGLNKALVKPERVEAVLDQVKAAGSFSAAATIPPAETVTIFKPQSVGKSTEALDVLKPLVAPPVDPAPKSFLARFWAGLKLAFGG
ncbi:MAG: hypothetical protein K2X84_10360 [Beijerinckiaceae bacterium]|nr:hypothetical protein [Beijerinckiaceae bacterium]